MFNNISRYRQDYNEAILEDAEGLQSFLEVERKKANSSYPLGKQVKCCTICGEPLVYDSISYKEDYHTDSCI